MIDYTGLRVVLASKNLKQKDLIAMTGLPKSTMARMSKNEYVSTETIDRICKALQCQPSDLMRYVEMENPTKE